MRKCVGCNRQDYSGYGKEKSFEYGLAVDEKWSAGTAVFLYKLAKTIEPWTAEELEQLRSAARMGPRAYEQFYFELRPKHRQLHLQLVGSIFYDHCPDQSV